MKIETKFNLGQEVYVITPYRNDWGGTTKQINIVEKVEIESIAIEGDTGSTQIMYWLQNRRKENEEFIFATKTEAEAKLKGEEIENFEVPDYDSFFGSYPHRFIFLNKKGTRKFYMWTAGNIHLDEIIDRGYCFDPKKEFINEPISKESYEKARKMCYDLYLDKEVQDDSVCD